MFCAGMLVLKLCFLPDKRELFRSAMARWISDSVIGKYVWEFVAKPEGILHFTGGE